MYSHQTGQGPTHPRQIPRFAFFGCKILRSALPSCASTRGNPALNCCRSTTFYSSIYKAENRVLEYLSRFIVGGVAVSAFAALGDMLRPKSFAGLFGAAPSIALATILITIAQKGAPFVAVEGRSMIVGAFALAAYSWIVCVLLKKFTMSSWTATTLALVVWFVVAFGITSIFLVIQ
jgi:hypothetical protein